MNRTLSKHAVLPIAILLTGGFLWFVFHSASGPSKKATVPDFAANENVQEKKDTFFEFMLPIIRRVNEAIRKERQLVNHFSRTVESGRDLSERDARQLAELMIKYRLIVEPYSDAENIAQLLRRVDTIPAPLVLAQSANDSAWGTARFPREGNNYFGLWCWSRNCSMLPSERDEGASHEVASFDTIEAGVAYFTLTLNSHPAYQLLRDLRAALKAKGKPVKGWDLAAGLLEYSERREAYVDGIREMITSNNLHRFTRVKYDY